MLRNEIELDQIFSDELAEDIEVIRDGARDRIRAIVIPVGQEVVTADGIVIGKRTVDLLVQKDQYLIDKKLEIPQQNDSFVLCDGVKLTLLVGQNGTFEWEVLDLVYRITTTVQ